METISDRYTREQTFLAIAIGTPIFFSVFRVQDIYLRIPSYIIIPLGLALLFQIGRISKFSIISTLGWVVFALINYLALFALNPNEFSGGSESLLGFFMVLLLSSIYIFVAGNISQKIVSDVLHLLIILEIYIAISFWIFSVATGYNIGVDIGSAGWMPRAHGFLSEPSYMSLVIPPALLISYIERNFKNLALSMCALVLAASPTVIFATILLITVFCIRKIKIYLSFSITLIIILLVYFLLKSNLMLADENTPSLLIPILRLIEGLQFFVATDSDDYSNTRGAILNQLFDVIDRLEAWHIGAGLGASVKAGDIYNNGIPIDVNFWGVVVLWYGLYFSFFFLATVVFCIMKLQLNSRFFSIYVGTAIACTINGGGVYFQCYFIGLTVIAMRSYICNYIVPTRVLNKSLVHK